MKIRWTEQSVRFRITPTELETLRRGQIIQTHLLLPGGWRASVSTGSLGTTLKMEAEVLRFLLSGEDAARLFLQESEGVYFQQTESGLRYYIEKDFPCEHPRPAEALENPETFERPPALLAPQKPR